MTDIEALAHDLAALEIEKLADSPDLTDTRVIPVLRRIATNLSCRARREGAEG